MPRNPRCLNDRAADCARTSTNLINRRLARHEETSVTLSQQLANVHQSVLSTHSTVLSLRYSENGICHPFPRKDLVRKRSCPQLPQDRLKRSRVYEQNADNLDRDTRTASNSLALTEAPRPASPFERSSSFFPEIYTSDSRFPEPCLAATGSYQESSSNDYRVNFYRLFYLKSPRNCHRLSISIRIDRTSIYWLATNICQREYRTNENAPVVGSISLPYSLLRKVGDFLEETGSVQEDVHFHLALSEKDEVRRTQGQLQPQTLFRDAQTALWSRQTLTNLDDLGCPRYCEDQVVQIMPIEPSTRFISCVNGKLVCEIRFLRPLPSPEFLYNIKVLHCMADVAGFARVRGVVTDAASTHLKSYLVDIPTSIFRRPCDEMSQRTNVPWQCREAWAKQLVEAVRELHSRDYVVGALSISEGSVLVDGQDRILIWRVNDTFRTGCRLGCYYPPEFDYLRTVSPTTLQADCPKITPKTDIFRLGLFLWFLAENVPRNLHSPMCVRNKCDSGSDACCDESHLDPVALPPLSEDVPLYYRNIVDLCRAEDPNDRPAAWRLLQMFPSTSGLSPAPDRTEAGGSEAIEGLDLDVIRGNFCRNALCDLCRRQLREEQVCGKRILSPFFHCNICCAGDYDICLSCYERGLHCFERHHLLVEVKASNVWDRPSRYHSSVKSSGMREILEL